VLDEEKCKQCDECLGVCRFEAIRGYVVDPISCEGCGVCVRACPERAITMTRHLSGRWFISRTRFGYMAHAKLEIAQENSGKLVSLVRQQAKLLAEREREGYIVIDGPPGIGCPVIAAITGVDLVLAVTEPTLSGLHDLRRVVGVAGHFGIPVVVCVNKFDINPENTSRIEEYCVQKGLEVVGRLNYDSSVTKAMVERKSIVEYPCGEITEGVVRIWERVSQRLAN
jgi:MinD superfamily P-loop ATPase